MKKVLLFGASGTLGTYLVDYLHQRKCEVIACGHRNINIEYYNSIGVNAYNIDITNPSDFNQISERNIDAVIQIAGAMPSRMEGYKPQLYIDVNVTGTLNILEYCRTQNIRKYLFTQSHSDVAGHWNTGKEISPYAERILNYKGDHAVYIISKNAAVDLIEHYHQDYGINTYIFRLPTIFSYRPIFDMFVNGENKPMGYRYFIQKALKGEDIELWGDSTITKDIVYVKDFCQMLHKALYTKVAKGTYNVATGTATTLKEQIEGVVKVFSPPDNPSRIIPKPENPSQISYLYEITNAIDELGYTPQYTYNEMLKDMKDEMLKNRFKHLEQSNPNI